MNTNHYIRHSFFVLICWALSIATGHAETIDASDPTKIYTYTGGGVKYTDYTNGASMTELRVTGNIGLSKQDMVLFELGYGSHSGPPAAGDNTGLTNSRVRWFHLFKMDYGVATGYRGWASQVDLQVPGELKGTNGQNVLALGGLAAFGINEKWSFFTGANLVNAWDKSFANWQGSGIAATALWVYSPEKWWKGAYLQIWPSYTRFVSGPNDGQASSNIDLTTGGSITEKVVWSATYQQNLDGNFGRYPRGSGTGLTNDWNVFVNLSRYF